MMSTPPLTSKTYTIWSNQKSQVRKMGNVSIVGRVLAENLDGAPGLSNLGIKSKIKQIFYWVQLACYRGDVNSDQHTTTKRSSLVPRTSLFSSSTN